MTSRQPKPKQERNFFSYFFNYKKAKIFQHSQSFARINTKTESRLNDIERSVIWVRLQLSEESNIMAVKNSRIHDEHGQIRKVRLYCV